MSSIRPLSRLRKAETKESLFRARKRIMKYLVLEFLREEGCFQAAETFSKEADLSGEYEVCDNIDLDIILQEYCSYYMMKFNKQPVFCKKVDTRTTTIAVTSAHKKSIPKRSTSMEACDEYEKSKEIIRPLTVTKLTREPESIASEPSFQKKPLSQFLTNSSSDRREMAELLYQGIIRNSTVKWDNVKGLESAKSLLLEAVVYPVKYPGVFTGILEPWKGILLHGPPGTGKTMLAKAVANECNCTFFNVTSSIIVNKWRGESEKIVKTLFEMAAYYAPSIIFVDELESLASERDCAGEHEASRRLKSQLLTELDGVSGRDGAIFLLACSNIPWDIDTAMLRRLEKRIYVPLPDYNTRISMFKAFLCCKNISLDTNLNLEEFAGKTEGYSGSDIKMVCKEAVMAAVRKILPDLCNKGEHTAKHQLGAHDIQVAITKTKPLSKDFSDKHKKWQSRFGSC